MSSLFTSLGLAGSALQAAGAAVRTVGQNIANADAEGYTRQRVELVARAASDLGRVKLGTGVEVARVSQVMDRRLEEMLRDARAALADLETRDRVLGRIESLLGELDNDSIASALSRFFDAAEDLVNRPEDHAARTLFAARGADLASTFATRDGALRDLRKDLEAEVRSAVDEVNRLTSEIAALNGQITTAEGGGVDLGAANDLRDRREALVKRLSELVTVKAVETSTGSLNILAGSDFLVIGTDVKPLTLDTDASGDVMVSKVRFQGSGQLLTVRGGKLDGLLTSRDRTVVDIRNELDALAKAVIGEVNRIHTGGEGLARWQEVTGTATVRDPDAPLSAADLVPPPRSGSFDLRITSAQSGLTDTYNITVDLDGLNGDDTSLRDLAARINAAVGADHPGVTASVTLDGRLKIGSADPALQFAFSNDTSGVLAGLGVGTFFAGRGASDMQVNSAVAGDPRLIATGRGGGSTDASNIALLSALRDSKVLEDGGATLEDFYRGTVGVLGVDRARARDLLQNQQVVAEHLQNERDSLSGVNIDEESIDLIRHQRAYQGAARFLSVVDSLLEALLNA